MELFLEVYTAFACAWEEEKEEPEYEQLRLIIYWFVSDYSEPSSEKRLREQLCPEEDFALRLIMDSNLDDLRYLYYFGEYISEQELEMRILFPRRTLVPALYIVAFSPIASKFPTAALIIRSNPRL